MIVPGRDSTLGPDAPQSPSPPTMPGGAVALARTDLASACLFVLLLGRKIPIKPPVYVGCGYDEYQTESGGHLGLDFYKTVGDVYVERSCGFTASGVAGANVYPAFPGCPHQGTAGKAKVIYAADAGGAVGNCVILEHTDNTHLIWIRTAYMHLNTIAVAVGAFVATTDVIGTVGGTGINPFTGRTYAADNNNHLHFEVWEQRAANLGWRTAAELTLMPNTITRPRSAINPEKYLPPVAADELLRIASPPPPPAGKPNWPPVDLPNWRPQVQYPCKGITLPDYFMSCGGLDKSVWGCSYTPGETLHIYPFMDAPDGKILVLKRIPGIGPGTITKGILLQHTMSSYEYVYLTYYCESAANDAMTWTVAEGSWIDMNTEIATMSAAPFEPGFLMVIYRIPVVLGASQDYYTWAVDSAFLWSWPVMSAYSLCPGDFLTPFLP